MKTRVRRTSAVEILAGCLLALLAPGCKEAGRSNVRLHLGAATSVAGLTSARVTASRGGATVKEAEFDWSSGATAIDVGLLVPAQISGEIQIDATGLASGQVVARSESVKVTVTPGQATAAVLQLLLQPIASATPDGGVDAAGGGGDAGADSGADNRTGTGGAGGSGIGGSGAGGSGTGGSGTGGRADAGTDAIIAARAWQPAIRAENNRDETDLRPEVAIDANGNALVVWEHGFQIWFNRYNAAAGTWGTEGPAVVAGGQAIRLGMDSQGLATVTWQGVFGNPDQGIWVVSSVAGGGWGTPFQLSTANAADARLAVSANGTAVAVWTENNGVSPSGNEYILWASRRTTPTGAWSAKTMLKNATDTGDRAVTIALDPTGNGFVIWEQAPAQPDPGNDTSTSVWISRYAGGVFGAAQAIESYTAGNSDSGHVALNALGNGVASWRQVRLPNLEVWTRTYDNGVWGTPTLVSSSTGIPFYQVPEVAIDNAGNSVVVWSQTAASGAYNARISRHRAGQASWDTPVPLETDNLSQGGAGTFDVSPEVRMDLAGNALVIWRKTAANGLVNIWSRRMDTTGALGTAVRIDNQNTSSAFAHHLAVAANGMAVAVWYYDLENDIWANVFR